MTKLKGSGEMPAAFATIIFVMVLLAAITNVIDQIFKVDLVLEATSKKVDMINKVHLVEACLAQGSFMTSEFLYDHDNNDVAGIKECESIGGLGFVVVNVKDLETGEEWKFFQLPERGRKQSAKIFVSIKSGDEIHVGEMHVEV